MRLPKPLKILLPLAALIALVISGCGGGGGDSTATTAETTETTPTLSKQELISQGDAICGEVNAAVGSVGASGAEVPDQITKVSDLYVGMVESIKRLGTPSEPAGYSEFIEAAEELATIEGEAKLAAEREDTTALGEAASKAAPALEEFETAAAVYGFEECSKEPSAPVASGGEASEESEEGGVEVAPEEVEEEAPVEEVAPEEAAPETGGAGGGAGVEEAAPEGGGTSSGGSGGVGPG